MSQDKWLFWDFDGTIAQREGHFSGALLKVLKGRYPDSETRIEDIQVFLKSGFPWHEPEKSYLHLTKSSAWWNNIEAVFIKAFEGVGCDHNIAIELSQLAHYEYINPEGFQLYEDTIETLEHFQKQGWKHAIFSNHVPELYEIVKYLGLDQYIEIVVSSANIGYEKPNKLFFEKALKQFEKISECCMIGDSITADIRGAESVGIKAILVRQKPEDGIRLFCRNLKDLRDII